MEKEQVKVYSCPFAGRMCREGIFRQMMPVCQFWNADTVKCRLVEAISRLGRLNQMETYLNVIAARQAR